MCAWIGIHKVYVSVYTYVYIYIRRRTDSKLLLISSTGIVQTMRLPFDALGNLINIKSMKATVSQHHNMSITLDITQQRKQI